MNSCEVLIVRHGQSVWNAEGRWQGQADPPLSQMGVDQAHHARPLFEGLSPVAFVGTSPLQRAAHTASIMAPLAQITTIDWLKERCAGPWQGLTRIEISDQWPNYLNDGRRPEGYENDAEVLDRVLEPFFELCSQFCGQRIMLVSHGGIIGAIERSAGMQWGRIPNLTGRWLVVNDRLITPGEQIQLANADAGEDPQAV